MKIHYVLHVKQMIKKAVSLFIVISLCLCMSPFVSVAYADVRASDLILGITAVERDLAIANCPSISAEFAVLMDKDGNIYYERNANSATKIASVTKIMTAYVTLQYCELNETITVSETAGTMDGSTANLQPGDVIDVKSALMGLLIPSGNDAGEALCEYVGNKIFSKTNNDYGDESKPTNAEEAFIAMMNKYAKDLGCKDTLYVNAHGLDDGGYEGAHHSTAYDQALITQACMKDETFREIVGAGDSYITVKRNNSETQLFLESTDYLLKSYDKCIGVKTGSTDLAGSCYVGAAEYDGIEVYAVILDAESDPMRFQDALDLFNWTFNHRVSYPLVNSSVTTEMTIDGEKVYVPVLAEVAHTGWVNATFKVTAKDPNGVLYAFDIAGNVSLDISYDNTSGNIRAGQTVGKIKYMQHNELIYECDLIAAEDCRAPNIFEMIGVWFDRLMRSFNNEPTVAVTKEVYTPKYLVNYNSAA